MLFQSNKDDEKMSWTCLCQFIAARPIGIWPRTVFAVNAIVAAQIHVLPWLTRYAHPTASVIFLDTHHVTNRTRVAATRIRRSVGTIGPGDLCSFRYCKTTVSRPVTNGLIIVDVGSKITTIVVDIVGTQAVTVTCELDMCPRTV